MKANATQVLREALYRLLRPLARVMLHHGMAYGSFAELARKAFVDECLATLRRSGRRPTVSAVSAQTGLTRKEASRLLDFEIGDAAENESRYNRAVRVVTAWCVDPRFVDAEGKPHPLPLEGENGFADLVHDYSGDIPPTTMLKTLEAGGTVDVVDQRVHLRGRAYLPTDTPGESLRILGSDVAELITTIDYNLTHDSTARVFQRKVSNTSVAPEALNAFRVLSTRKSQELLEEYDAWLARHEAQEDDDLQSTGHYVSVGIYYFDDTLNEDPEP
jgi:hypothetical protein